MPTTKPLVEEKKSWDDEDKESWEDADKVRDPPFVDGLSVLSALLTAVSVQPKKPAAPAAKPEAKPAGKTAAKATAKKAEVKVGPSLSSFLVLLLGRFLLPIH